MTRRLCALWAVLAIAAAGCGEGEEPVERNLPDVAREITEQTAALQADVADAARELLADGVDSERTEQGLEELEQRAIALRDRVEERLPERYAGREALRASNRRTVRAIQDLRAFVQLGDEDAVRRAADRLDNARQRLAAAADELIAGADDEDGRALEQLQRELDEAAPGVIAP